MKATEAKLLSFLQKSPQFVNPIYQHTCGGVGSGLSSFDVLPDVLGLLRQSYDREMGGRGRV